MRRRERNALVLARADLLTLQRREAVTTEDHDYKRRMNNWRLWRLSERRSFGGSPYPVYNLNPRPPRGENVMPILAGEAKETDDAIRALPQPLLRTVEVWYLREGSINQKRRMLGCRRERMLQRLEEARRLIVQFLAGVRPIGT